MNVRSLELPSSSEDGHQYRLIARIADQPKASLLWLPALGVAARHYTALAEGLASRGIAVFLHEMRGNGSSSLRASRQIDWGYREILAMDVPCSVATMAEHCGGTPLIIGGHSIGAQFAACYAGLHPDTFARLWLVASGSPYWRNFPAPKRYAFPFALQFVPWLADLRGTFPGRALGFGGDEARTLMRDWAKVGLGNRYAAAGLEVDLEAALSRITARIDAVLLDRDWFAPRHSMQALLAKMPHAASRIRTLDSATLGVRADHFAWMKQPQAVCAALLESADFDA